MDWIVYGIRSPYARDIAGCIARRGDRVAAFVDNLSGPGAPDDVAPVVAADAIDTALADHPVTVPIMTPGHRKSAAEDAARRGFDRFKPMIDPTAILTDDVAVADGASINAGSVIGAGSVLGRFAIVNRSASIGHHVRLDEFVSIGPGAVLCGMIRVGRGAFVGAGAVISPEVEIGENAVVGAGAVVVANVEARAVVFGNPARVKRIAETGYKGQTV